MKSYILLKEKALVNIDLLFNYWKLSYTKINNEEYDFISPIREDNNFGACRFNSIKGIGSDFAGSAFDNNDFNNIGLGFNKEDFNSIIDGKIINSGFDIIGLTQRLHGCTSYKTSKPNYSINSWKIYPKIKHSTEWIYPLR